MNMSIRSKIVQIGNSRGLRIPRALLKQAGLENEVEMSVEDNQLIIRAVREIREGWDEQYAAMAANGDDHLLDEYTSTEWDEGEWKW